MAKVYPAMLAVLDGGVWRASNPYRDATDSEEVQQVHDFELQEYVDTTVLLDGVETKLRVYKTDEPSLGWIIPGGKK